MPSREFKEGEACVKCGTTSGKHMGRGLCSPCYQKERRNFMKTNEIESEQVSEIEFPVLPDGEFVENLETDEIRPGLQTDPSTTQGGSSFESNPEESIADKAKNFFGFGTKKTETKTTFKTNEKRPKAPTKRVSGAQSIADGWNAIGGIISRSPRHRPSGILLQWQSAAAGEIIDEAIKDTAIDRMLIQKAVKARGRFDLIGSVLLPPALVFAIEMNPERAPMLIPMLESSLRNSLPHMVPAIKKARKREEEQQNAIRELFPDLPEGIDPIQELIQEMFAGWYPEQEEAPIQEGEFIND